MKIRWHYPDYMDFDHGEEEAEFANQAELLALPRIRELMAQQDLFQRWTVADYHGESGLLLLIDKEEKQWVIGYIPLGHGLDFPVWKPRATGITFRITQNEMRDATVVEVYMDGQFRATLTPGRDGRSIHLISTHLNGDPVKDQGGDIPSYQFSFRRERKS
jgi:hypothetical protein